MIVSVVAGAKESCGRSTLNKPAHWRETIELSNEIVFFILPYTFTDTDVLLTVQVLSSVPSRLRSE